MNFGTGLTKFLNLKDERIVIISETTYGWYLSYMTLLCGAGIAVPLDKELPVNEIENLIKRSKATAVIYSAKRKEQIDKVKDNVVVSIAHTAADYDTAMEAIQHGVTHATHLYNAMPPMNHRKPGVIGAVRDSYQCHAELICDGVHIHPSVIRATFAMLGAGRIILISDSMRATGLEDGEYTLGGQPVVVKGNLATLHDGTIAGSATNLMDCLRYVVKKAGISLETAVMCATENPAKEIGIYDKVGSISVGKQADFVLIDEELNIKRVYIDGKEIIC